MKKKQKILLFAAIIAMALCTVAFGVSVSGEVDLSSGVLIEDTTYVPLRAFCCEIGYPEVQWDAARSTAQLSGEQGTFSVGEGNRYLQVNDRLMILHEPTMILNNTLYVPLRGLCAAWDLTVTWDAATESASVAGAPKLCSEPPDYDAQTVDLLARIIFAESEGEPLAGMVAVGNVVLNRVQSEAFPDTLWGVIYDTNNGVQFEPSYNGRLAAIEPDANSVLAAKLALEGMDIAGDCLYFFNPDKTAATWIKQTRSYFATIGRHCFYL